MKYRIKENTYKSGDKTYKVQRLFLWFFWVDTLKLDFPFIYAQHIYTGYGCTHYNYNDAAREIEEQVKHDLRNEKVSTKIMTFSYEES